MGGEGDGWRISGSVDLFVRVYTGFERVVERG